jgi:hypothetical protein
LGVRDGIRNWLDPALCAECQAALLNLEDLLVQEFGNKWALQEQLAVSLQFSRLILGLLDARRLFSGLPAGVPRLLFKGGTSLSKSFGLIDRFSEDIDITVFRNDLGEGRQLRFSSKG